eukprot:11176475-Lingulodinium_polyedra.AAC.1
MAAAAWQTMYSIARRAAAAIGAPLQRRGCDPTTNGKRPPVSGLARRRNVAEDLRIWLERPR